MSKSYSLPGRRAAAAAVVLAGSLALFGATAPAQAAPTAAPNKVIGGLRLPVVLTSMIPGHVPELVKSSAMLSALPADQALSCSITLPLRNRAALDDLLHGLSNPADPRYGQFLTPTQFGEQFGASPAEYAAVVSYLQSKGLAVTQTYPSRTYLSVAGTASQMNAAFGVALKQFRAPDGHFFHAPDTDVRVPAGIAGYISAVTGLDDATPPVPLIHQIRARAASKIKALVPAASGITPLVQDPGEQGTGPGGGFSPKDLRTAYGLDGTALDGTGQTIAIVEYGTNFNIKDALKYENQFGLKHVPITVINVDGPSSGFAGAGETDLDIACQLSMAPNASLRIYLDSGASTTNPLYQIANDNIAKQLSISYGFGSESATATAPSATQVALNTVYTQLAAQGISVYVSSGDSGSIARSTSRATSVDISSSTPMVCSVGGTALVVQKPGIDESYLSESTWNYNGTGAGGAGGGGVSRQWPVPSYQVNAATFASAIPGSNVSATKRNIPDISCDASPETGIALYISFEPDLSGNGWYVFGGTSASAPLWAGYTALVNQNRALAGLQGPLGFPNYSLYSLAYSSAGLTSQYTSLFHDINDGSSNLTIAGGANYAAVKGYDASTGLGTMQGIPLITALSQGNLVK